MALDFNTLKRLSDTSFSKWTPQDFALFGIPPENQKSSTAARLRSDINLLVSGIESANKENAGGASLSIAESRLNKYGNELTKEIQKFGGNPSVVPTQLIQNTLNVVSQRRAGQTYTPTMPGVQAAPPKAPAPTTPAPAAPRAPSPAPVVQSQAPVVQSQVPQVVVAPTPAPVSAPLAEPFANTALPMPAPAPTPVAAPQPQQTFLSGGALTPENLPALRGAASGTSSIDPTLRPYLELGLRGAEQLFLQQQPSLYPGQMFVGPSPQTQAALNMQEDIALAQPTSLQAAQESYMRGLGGLAATAGGAFLGMNPFQQQAIEAATRPLAQQYEQQVLPGVSSLFSRAGRYGSEAMGTALGRATEASARAIGDVSSNIAYQGYEAERARQQQAMGAQLSGATLAPQIYGQQFLPSQQLAQVGAAREAIAAQPLQEAIQRYQFQQQIPYQQLQGFLSSVYGTPMGSSQYQPPGKTNQLGQVLGSAAIGAGLGGLFGGAGGFTGSQIGAGLGALGGLLF